MQQLSNKRIVLGVTGGIAAYKSAELIRQLTRLGADVRVVMTRAACEFITPLTLQALSHNPVHLDLLDTGAEAAMGHIELARWADVVLVAPATADFIARLAGGHADDLLTTLCLATSAPVCLAPAMNQGMWRDSVTQQNCEELLERNISLFGPGDGSQACGDIGPGRMLDPELIVEQTSRLFTHDILTGLNVLITAGGTREDIDPVRYISNHSSGKMGFAIAEAAVASGATVTLITGPVHLDTPDRVKRVDVVSARDMHQAVHDRIAGVDIFIGCAAVSDYRPAEVAREKIKKDPENGSETLDIKLVRNPDIIASVTGLDTPPFVVGFAAETHNVLGYAADKLRRKKMNLVVANDVGDRDIGFSSDANEVTVIGEALEEPLPRASKKVVSRKLLQIVARRFRKWKSLQSTTETNE
ncbi:bifunctional phosphopantothenoylcysteine decarboxylase/phosphopantothenate--cysteine ligase CoaBC [Endozoicomonas sp. SCSIO W0465]|uniref:bifunctional phosphopantothenoylcysteine decarboxylase/phosphopantothenate--cysteine ligase CoaBC n=1 Tax=Endozoicomonas sp. SCSIO W0465 TaxID=2918516 RepID=UPI00207632CA|nr:bifunctional phosphopantothenoylcysteine decarboxylase/phosphopantothenate--cysteine ligase CoaBC [Endozoicomonas sp. SCSIO W0465]USE36890.1 bifunctional phosphopantothenoylcysteine decarboxylase/phosphopantothenate--cysteine ligase CoaBC [Endozoicomonas sp. SCSIO W0465]